MKNPLASWGRSFLIAGSLLLSSHLSAYDCCDCDVDFCDLTQDACYSLQIGMPIFCPCEEIHWANIQETATLADELLYVEWDWSVGVEVGFDVLLPCPNWSLQLGYTYFGSEGFDSAVDPGAGGTLDPMLGGSADALASSIKLDMDYHLIDLVIGRECCVCDTLQISPFAGFRALLWDREAVEESSGGPTFTTAGDGGSSRQDYNGYGLTAGFAWKHCAFENIRFFGKFGASTVVGEIETHLDRRQGGASIASVNNQSPCHPAYAIESTAGLSYEHCFCDWHLSFTLAYEMQTWFNIPSLTACYYPGPTGPSPFDPMNTVGNVSMQGVSLGVGFEL